MSLPATFEAVLIVALVFVPGIIFGQLIRRSIAHFPETVDGRHYLAMGASGLFLHTLIYPFTTRYVVDWYLDGTISTHWLATYCWVLFAIFAWPVIVSIVIGRLVTAQRVDALLDTIGLGYVDRTPSAWDYAIRGRSSRSSP